MSAIHPDHRPYSRGFTIVELLVVIVVIAILAAITVVAYNGVQARARDSRRANDIENIRKALLTYDAVNGGVYSTYLGSSPYTGGTNYSGWDASVSANWLAFLRTSNGTMPVDPVNTLTGNDPPSTGNRNYFYYCYVAGYGNLPATDNVSVGYHKEDNTLVRIDFPVTRCLSS